MHMNRPPLAALRQIRSPADLWRRRELRYLVVGGINTLFGYSLGVGLYLALSPRLHILVIGVIGSVIAITFSFTTYKLWVFGTHGHWLREYLRSYVVYGGTGVLGILLIWLLVDGLRLPIWIAQGIAILLTIIFSYLGHARFTFRPLGCKPPEESNPGPR
jgi:putative flippase GtrA